MRIYYYTYNIYSYSLIIYIYYTIYEKKIMLSNKAEYL